MEADPEIGAFRLDERRVMRLISASVGMLAASVVCLYVAVVGRWSVAAVTISLLGAGLLLFVIAETLMIVFVVRLLRAARARSARPR